MSLYCLENEIEIGSVNVGGLVTCLNFVKSIIVCGTTKGQLVLVDSQSLEIKKKYLLSDAQILFCLTSADYRLFAYSSKNKSRIIDLEKGEIFCQFDKNIMKAQFCENRNLFVLIDHTLRLNILKDYSWLIKIDENIFFPRIYLCSSEMKVVVRGRDNAYFIFDINHGQCEAEANKLRELKKDRNT